ncbi:MAG: hypothetical protein JWN03_4094 [Nocardia sp.]|nr:hypothetical protein [Nocardia sp.]
MSNFEDTPTPTSTTKPRVPCSAKPTDWDLDASGPDEWHRSIETCQRCPVFSQCDNLAQVFAAAGIGPRGMIWAGVAYDNNGRIVLDINQHKNSLVPHGPMRITRRLTSAPPSHQRVSNVLDMTKVKGVHLVIGRRGVARTSPDIGTTD